MKNLITVLALLSLSTAALAHKPDRGMRPGLKKKSKTVVVGKKAEAIFEALNTDLETKDLPKFTVEVKEVASLKCAKLIKKEDTSKVTFKCSLAGKKLRRGQGPRRGQRRDHPRRGRGHRQGRGHGHGHGQFHI